MPAWATAEPGVPAVEFVIQLRSPSSQDGYDWIGIVGKIDTEDAAWQILGNLAKHNPGSSYRIIRIVTEVMGGVKLF